VYIKARLVQIIMHQRGTVTMLGGGSTVCLNARVVSPKKDPNIKRQNPFDKVFLSIDKAERNFTT
jgi:hypothetical protein